MGGGDFSANKFRLMLAGREMKLGKLMIISAFPSSSFDGTRASTAAFGKLDPQLDVRPTTVESR